MKKITLAFLLLGALATKAQEVKKDSVITALKESIDEHSMKFSGLEERLAASDADLGKLTKIKVSGYVQAQYDMFDSWKATGLRDGISNQFRLRRARIKFAYEAADGVKFVLQPDFAFDKVSLKDAYVVLNDRWSKTFSLYMGQFDRPNYEVEYSSGSMEMLERTTMAGVLYPGEKELGAKLEANFDTKYNFPLKLQLAVLNGNFDLGSTSQQTKDIDSGKDVMARAVYSVKLPNSGLGIDFGGHGYFGKTEVLKSSSDLTKFYDVNNKQYTAKVGDKLDKSWLGAEMQIYYDFLGGMSLKGEYIAGKYSNVAKTDGSTIGTVPGSINVTGSAVAAANSNPKLKVNGTREFKGFYAQLVKNIGSKNQIIARYDEFDPNSKLAGNLVGKDYDLKYSTWTFSYQYFFDDNVKINFGYSLPTNEKSTNAGLAGTDFVNRDKRDNTFTIRLQAKF